MAKHLIFIPFFLLLAVTATAQTSADLGVTGGVTYYIGDLNPKYPFLMSKPAYGALYRLNFNDRISLRLHGIRGDIAGDDAVSRENTDRNLNFTSSLTEVGVQFEINYYEFFTGSRMHRWTPYIFGGVSAFFFNPYGTVNGSLVALRPLHTEGQEVLPDMKEYKLYSVSLPFGMGVKYSINKLFAIGAEWGMRKTGTDYLDDVSTTYYLNLANTNPSGAAVQELASDPTLLHNAGMQRGNSRNSDWYSYAGLSLTVKVRMLRKERCLDHQKEGY